MILTTLFLVFCFASKSSFYSKSVCAFFCFFFFFFFFLYTTETLNKAQREEVCEKKSWKLKSRTQTRAHKTPSLSLSYSLTLIKVHDRLKSSRPWYDFATATTTVYPSCGRLFSFERCDWITPSSSLLCRRFRPLIVPLDLSSSFKSVSPVSLSVSLSSKRRRRRKRRRKNENKNRPSQRTRRCSNSSSASSSARYS